MKKLIFIWLLASCQLAFAQSDQQSLGKLAANFKELIPHGWKLIAEAKGDLNNDSLADLALVIEKTDPKNIINNKDGLGSNTLNTNPRRLLVAFKQADGKYKLVNQNDSFIPPPNSKDNPCLEDPFEENGRISISKGLLKIYFQNFYSCGAWEIYNFDYIFRYQNHQFELIGYNKSSMHRSSGEETTLTVNFSTRKMNYTSGSNAFKTRQKTKTSWKNFKLEKMFELSTIKQESLERFNY